LTKFLFFTLLLIIYSENLREKFKKIEVGNDKKTTNTYRDFLEIRDSKLPFLQQEDNSNIDKIARFVNFNPGYNTFDSMKDVKDFTKKIADTTPEFTVVRLWHSTGEGYDKLIVKDGFKPTIPDDYIYDGGICGRLKGNFFALYDTTPTAVHYPRSQSIMAPTFIISNPNNAFTNFKLGDAKLYFITFTTGKTQFGHHTTQILLLMTLKSSEELEKLGVVAESLNPANNPFLRIKDDAITRVPETGIAGYGGIHINLFINTDEDPLKLKVECPYLEEGKNINRKTPCTLKKIQTDLLKKQKEKEKEEIEKNESLQNLKKEK